MNTEIKHDVVEEQAANEANEVEVREEQTETPPTRAQRSMRIRSAVKAGKVCD